MSTRILRCCLLLPVLLAAPALAACGGSDQADPGITRQVAVNITDDGCDPVNLKTEAGPTTFRVTNAGSDINNEFEVLDGALILGERENLVAGLTGEVSLNLDPGTYDIVCGNPGNREPTGKLLVSGSRAPVTENAGLRRAAAEYGRYVNAQVDLLVRRTTGFVAAVKAGDLSAARRLYETARIPYERIEPVAEAFGDLDPAIDARENDVAAGEKWTGFHPLEKALWGPGLTAADSRTADRLLRDVKRLQRRVKGKSYDPLMLANGAVELLNEVSQSKITGEEERYSHVDLTDFKANVDGARRAFDLLRPELAKADPDLTTEVVRRFQDLERELARYRTKGELYVNYRTVNEAQRRALSQKVDALALPLSRVGGALVAR